MVRTSSFLLDGNLIGNYRYVCQGREAEARAVLIKYHGDGDPDALVANLELQEMREVIEQDGSDKRWWDFRALFNTRAARYRTFLVTCISWFGELDLPPTSYYFPLMGKCSRIILFLGSSY